MTPEQISLFPMWYVAFLLSLTCHEGAHALAAKWGGDLTAFHAGQVTLNPLPHIRREPFGTVLMPVLSYVLGGSMLGWASAPYDPYWQRRHPRRAAWMAAAGPIANFLIVVLVAIAIRVGIVAGLFAVPDSVGFTHVVDAAAGAAAEGAATFLSILFSLNLLLGLFNLLPVPPLDGNAVVTLLMPERTALRWLDITHNQTFAFIGLIVAWRLFDPFFSPLYIAALRALYLGA